MHKKRRSHCYDGINFLTFFDSSCCRDVDFQHTPAICQPECADYFMCFYSRCGATIFSGDASTMAKIERFNRLCAVEAGRDIAVEAVTPGTTTDSHAQLNGPDFSDPCSGTSTCAACSGECGWCANELTAAILAAPNGWCSSECVTTAGECKVNAAGH